jgi:tRNA(fMet)-specific endonuclease VapC
VKYVLDANIAIAALNGVPSVRTRLSDVTLADVGIPIVALAELTFGPHKSKRREENLARIAALRRDISVLPFTEAVVDLYGSIRAELETRGLVKSDFDLTAETPDPINNHTTHTYHTRGAPRAWRLSP